MKQHYLMVLNQHLASLFQHNEQEWQSVPLNGEMENPCANHAQLTALLQKLDQRINLSDRLQNVSLQIFCHSTMQNCLPQLPEEFANLQCQDWAIHCVDEPDFSIEQALKLAKKVAQSQAETPEIAEEKPEENEAENNTLLTQQQSLQQEIEALKTQLATMQKPPITQLATFLPIIYKNFWLEISENDLALLADSFELPKIERQVGGVQEPSRHTIERKKKAFLALSEEDRSKILDFCRNELPHSLTVRPEMQSIVEI